ncbi:hypothetical protein BDR06DRAFT_970804 [Suillus hirtellus]|nr:hypothetical protein BDR06DRAFT_970804 [Suillus hirtellus]
MFRKCVTKLTEKVAQAVAKGSHKLKQKASSISNKTATKKLKKVPSESNETVSPSPSPCPLASTANIHTEEEEECLHGDAIVIDSDTESAKSKASVDDSDGEASEDELGKSLIPVVALKSLISIVERIRKSWTSPVHTFFELTPSIKYTNGCHALVFKCISKGCKQRVQRYLDKGDAKLKSTSNMVKHVRSCWGEAVYKAAQDAKTAEFSSTKMTQAESHTCQVMVQNSSCMGYPGKTFFKP